MTTSKQRRYAGSVQYNRRIGEQLLKEKGLVHPADRLKSYEQQWLRIYLTHFFAGVSEWAKQQMNNQEE